MPRAGICRVGPPSSSGARVSARGIIRTPFGPRAKAVQAGFVNPTYDPIRIIEGLRRSPLHPHIALCVTELKAQDYHWRTVAANVQVFGHLARWLQRTRRSLRTLNETVIARFLDKQLGRSAPPDAKPALVRLLSALRAAGVAPPAAAIARTSAQALADDYRCFLAQERGLDSVTIYHYARHAEKFLDERFGRGAVACARLRARDVTTFVLRHARQHSRGYALQLVNALRSFFRFLHYRGLTTVDWSLVVPTVAHWRMSHLPKHLPADAVRRVLAGCARSTPVGRRDYAVLLLLARLGLRAAEVIRLQLDDVDWEQAQLTVRSKKGRGWARLPLPADVGRALAEYLQSARPACASRSVFVRFHAPHRPLAKSATISNLVRTAIESAGVKAPRTGAHVFRHSLATEMLRQGASLDEIGQVLRHKDSDTTAIYAKVDLGALRSLAVALPGGVR